MNFVVFYFRTDHEGLNHVVKPNERCMLSSI